MAEVLKLDSRAGRRDDRGRAGWLIFAAGLFAVIYFLRLFDDDARNGIAFMYALPVALVALRFGFAGGVLGACLGMALTLANGNPDLILTPVGHGTRGVILFIVGASIGWFADREHRWQRERLEAVAAEQRRSAARMLSAQEGERVRLARELHDEIGQSVTGLMLELDRLAKAAPESITAELRETQEAARQISDELRTIVRRLRPEALDVLGLNRALIALCERISETSTVMIERRLARDLPRLSSDAELVVYRVAQESLTNVIRHSGAKRVTLELDARDGGVRLRVADDGRGIGHTEAGSGIQGMRERAMLIEAQLAIRTAAVGGTEVVLDVPAAAPSIADGELSIAAEQPPAPVHELVTAAR